MHAAARLAQLPQQQPRPVQLHQRHADGAADGGDGEAELRWREIASDERDEVGQHLPMCMCVCVCVCMCMCMCVRAYIRITLTSP